MSHSNQKGRELFSLDISNSPELYKLKFDWLIRILAEADFPMEFHNQALTIIQNLANDEHYKETLIKLGFTEDEITQILENENNEEILYLPHIAAELFWADLVQQAEQRNIELAQKDFNWTPEELAKYVAEKYSDMEYRPTVVNVMMDVRNHERKFLLLKTAKENAATPWSFHQGGVDEGESVRDARVRELYEELGIQLVDFSTISNGAVIREIPIERNRKDKRDFTRGKAYIVMYSIYEGGSDLAPQEDDIAECKWCTYGEAVELLNLAREEKRVFLKSLLDVLKKIE